MSSGLPHPAIVYRTYLLLSFNTPRNFRWGGRGGSHEAQAIRVPIKGEIGLDMWWRTITTLTMYHALLLTGILPKPTFWVGCIPWVGCHCSPMADLTHSWQKHHSSICLRQNRQSMTGCLQSASGLEEGVWVLLNRRGKLSAWRFIPAIELVV